MIGSLLAAHYIGKKPWGMSAIFWAILLVISMVTAVVFPTGVIMLFLLGFIIFIAVAMYYLKTNWWMSIIMYIAALIINIAIGFILSAVGVALPW